MNKLSAFSTAVIRTSAFPVSLIKEIFEVQDDSWVSEILQDDQVKIALALASPELLDKVSRLHELSKNDPEYRKLRQSLLKYISRMSSRCTPFGLFSGVGTIGIQQESAGTILKKSAAEYKRHFRLDMDFSVKLVQEICQDSQISKVVHYFTNTTLYKLGDYWRYVQYSTTDKNRVYELVSLESSPYLERIIDHARGGASRDSLIGLLIDDDITFEEASEFMDEIIASQLIINELEPSTIGPEIEIQLLEGLQRIRQRSLSSETAAHIDHLIRVFSGILQLLDSIGTAGTTYEDYNRTIQYLVRELPFNLQEINEKFLIQCTLGIAFDQQTPLSSRQLKMVEKALEICSRFVITSPNNQEKDIDKFRSAFHKRYEDRIVPLVEALDVETGIGYGSQLENEITDFSDLLDGLAFNYTTSGFETHTWHTKIRAFWDKKIADSGNEEIRLTAADLKTFETTPLHYAPSFTAMTSFYKDGDSGDVLHFDYFTSSTTSAFTGRFCNGNEDLNNFNAEVLQWENTSLENVLVAELNHLPQSRLGNVILRPHSRAYQINYVAGHNDPANPSVLPIEDLYIAVRNNKLMILSKTFQKEVRVFHSNAYNKSFPGNLPIFKFLADAAEQENYSNGSMNLSNLHRYHSFIPRVRFENIILHKASWQLMYEEWKPVFTAPLTELLEVFTEWRTARNIPDLFVIEENDNRLLLNANNTDCIEILGNHMQKHGKVIVTEFLLSEFRSAVGDAEGNEYNNEILFSFKGSPNSATSLNTNNLQLALNTPVKEIFHPGSEWIYFKIYLGLKSADKLIAAILPFLEDLKSADKISKWFFIRYSDPKFHIRLRLKLNEIHAFGPVVTRIHQFLENFNESSIIETFSLNTYQRELERYGYDCIDLFETIFYHDSVMCIELIDHCNQYEEDQLWMCGLYSMSTLCNVFGVKNEEKIAFLNRVTESFRNEFNASPETTKGLNLKYNSHKNAVYELFMQEKKDGFYTFTEIVQRRNDAIQAPVQAILNRFPQENDRLRFLNSVIHMSINRQFRSKQRLYEFVLSDFLKKVSVTRMHTMTQRV